MHHPFLLQVARVVNKHEVASSVKSSETTAGLFLVRLIGLVFKKNGRFSSVSEAFLHRRKQTPRLGGGGGEILKGLVNVKME